MGERAGSRPPNVDEGSCFPATRRLLRDPGELLGWRHELEAGRDKVAGHVGLCPCPDVLG